MKQPMNVIALRASRAARAPFPISKRSRSFLKRFYADATVAQWSDWRWQSRQSIRTLAQVERLFALSDDERSAIERHRGALPLGITPYYASLMSATDPAEPLRRTHIPVNAEFTRLRGEADDPLAEDANTVAPGLVHRYPDRALFLVTKICATYCRYCMRSRMVGPGGEYTFSSAQWELALAYLEQHAEIRDVLLSGGDPLTIADEKLDWLLARLRRIKHIEFIRIGTKIPMVLPMRVTRDLVRVLKRHRPWLSLHVTHPAEMTTETAAALERLADAGLPLGSQTVLMAGINDDVEVMKKLMHELLVRRVKPYYLFQCDPIKGSGHFRTPVDKGLEIIRGLRGHTTGYAVPQFALDAPGGGGKITLVPDYVLGRDGDDLIVRNYEGDIYRYPDPGGTLAAGTTAPES
ncbi:MAG: KamA family radical SAM protein [Alphaproteobacteria bacterium]|nr:KamA family radical SAM protein [Alphaproteobacteria bacterium]